MARKIEIWTHEPTGTKIPIYLDTADGMFSMTLPDGMKLSGMDMMDIKHEAAVRMDQEGNEEWVEVVKWEAKIGVDRYERFTVGITAGGKVRCRQGGHEVPSKFMGNHMTSRMRCEEDNRLILPIEGRVSQWCETEVMHEDSEELRSNLEDYMTLYKELVTVIQERLKTPKGIERAIEGLVRALEYVEVDDGGDDEGA